VGLPPDKNSIFRVFRVPFDHPAHSVQKTVLAPNQWYRWKAETLKVCLLLVRRVCDQAFGRYRPLKGAEKWSRDHHENCKFANCKHIEKFTDSKNAIVFDLRREISKLSQKKTAN